jgi:hypothetical protein
MKRNEMQYPEKLYEAGREVDVAGNYQIVVVGGGVAGIAAALAAARNGARTLLIERDWLLGGLGTQGLVTIYLPLCDGNGRQVVYGIGEELLQLAIHYGAEEEHLEKPLAWLEGGSDSEKKRLRYQVQYHPYTFALCAEKLLQQNGVEILYGTTVCGVQNEAKKIKALFTENKSGRQAILTGTVVDASGDANVCWLAGADTKVYSAGNILASWHYYFAEGEINLRMMGAAEKFDAEGQDVDWNGIRQEDAVLLKNRRFVGLDGVELSEMVQLSHKALLDSMDKEREKRPDYYPVLVPTIPQIRMTRRLAGEYAQDATESFTHYEDAIGMTGDWRKAGPVYEIPYRCLYGKEIHNLLVAGRCISVTDSMWDITRVIPACAVTGQAAGTAAALAVQTKDCDVMRVDVNVLQKKLRNVGVRLFLNDIHCTIK